jgi:hypothetical protein
MSRQGIEAAAEAIWKKMNLDHPRKDWATQPDHVKFLPRLYARAALEAVEKLEQTRGLEPAAEPPLADFGNIPPAQKKAWAEETWTEGRKKVAQAMGWVWNPTDKCWIQGDKSIHPAINAKWMISLNGKYLPGTFAGLEEAKAAFPTES